MQSGYAEFKTHVLRREEKGLMGVPFKRFMSSAVIAAGGFFIIRMVTGPLAVPCAILIYCIALIFQMERGGLPLYIRLFLRWRGNFILRAAHHPDSLTGRLAVQIRLPIHLAQLNADVLFAPPTESGTADLSDIVMFACPEESESDSGLVHVDDPLADLLVLRHTPPCLEHA